MARNKSNISVATITEWMASTGFLFPRNILELKRFEKLHSDVEINLTGHQIDPEVILGLKPKNVIITATFSHQTEEPHLRMAARKGDSNISQHILDKIKKNQAKRKNDDLSNSEDSA